MSADAPKAGPEAVPVGPDQGLSARAARTFLVGLTRLVTGARARWAGGVPAEAQRVYFANHSSHLDTLVIWSSLPAGLRARTRPVAAADYWDKAGLRRWLARRVLNVVLVDRAAAQEGLRGSREALRCLLAALDLGDSLILFPEGTRGDGVQVGELKPGLFLVARERPGVGLVPVYLQNLSRILPKGEVLPVPLLASVTFGGAIRLEPGEGRREFLERARQAIVALGAGP
jgi:1-acyl-sn-glycerol-3-phosphate acyltransferase